MKRWVFAGKVLVVLVVALKLAAAGGVLQGLLPEAAVIDPGPALATVPQKGPAPPSAEEPYAQERKLAASLAERQKQLESREIGLKEEEKKLQSLKGEIVAKIDALRALEEKLSGMLDTVKSAEDKRLRDLATVFEATPPAQAGPMLEKMDKRLAAGIIMNMKSKKAGAVWGHISAQRAAEVAKEIAGMPKPGE